MPVMKTPPTYEVEYVNIPVSVSIVEGLYPYLVEEAARRGLSVDTVASSILNENLARKRIQSRTRANKKMKPPVKTLHLNCNKQ